jgi:hypothetical protein
LGADEVAAAADAAGEEAAAGALLLLLLQAARPRAAAAKAATAAPQRRDRVAGIEGTARLLCARSLGGGLAVRPVGRVPARSIGIFAAVSGVRAKRTNVRNTVTELDRKRGRFFDRCQELNAGPAVNETDR